MSAVDARAERLVQLAQQVSCDVRDDISAAHRVVRHLDRIDLEGLVVVLAALVDVDRPVVPWWQHPHAEQRLRQQLTGEALAPRRVA